MGAGSTQHAERKIARDVFPSPLFFVIPIAPGLFILRGESRFLLHAWHGVNRFPLHPRTIARSHQEVAFSLPNRGVLLIKKLDAAGKGTVYLYETRSLTLRHSVVRKGLPRQ